MKAILRTLALMLIVGALAAMLIGGCGGEGGGSSSSDGEGGASDSGGEAGESGNGESDVPSGSLVAAFGTGGVVQSNPSTAPDQARAIAIDSSAIYVVGYDRETGNYQWRIEKRDRTTGTLVDAFGLGGVIQSNPSTNWHAANAIAIDSSAIYIVGDHDGGSSSQWWIEKRDRTTGALVGAFGLGGVIQSDPSTGTDRPSAIAIDSSAMYVVGCDDAPGDSQWRIEKRNLTTGALVSDFGPGGIIQSDPSTGTDRLRGVAIDSSAIYVVGEEKLPTGGGQWRIEKRDRTTGALVDAFGPGGVIRSNSGLGADEPEGIAIDSSAIYIVGYDRVPGNSQWRIEKRDCTTGALVGTFGPGGVIQSDPSTNTDRARAVAIDSSAIYVVGHDSAPNYYQWRMEKRDRTTGSLVGAFGTDGVVHTSPGEGYNDTHAIAIDSSAIYVIGYDNAVGNHQWRIEKRWK